jgi:pyruvate kinase
MQKLTKIVATISDKKCEVEFLKQLYFAGMNVVRINTAHQTRETAIKVINNIRQVSEKIAILIDTKGPEIRTTKSDFHLSVKYGDIVFIKGDPTKATTPEMVYVSYENFVRDIPVGSNILIDDGELELKVIEKDIDKLTCKASNDGYIQGKKSVNIPSVHITLPTITEKDKDFIEFAAEQNVDFIAHSFVRNKEDVMAVQEILNEKKSNIKIIAKIENQDGVDNIEEILDHAYGIMIARGDLAIEIPKERIPIVQKQLIRKCIEKRKPVITATQMLHTMIKNPRPTRAEVSDVANAIYDGSDAIMLSGETAYGDYALESVQTMTQIALEIENNKCGFLEIPFIVLNNEISAYLAKAAVKASYRLKNVRAIVADSTSGRTIRALAAYRGNKPVYAICYNKEVMRELSLSYGVYPTHLELRETTDEFLDVSISKLLRKKVVDNDDLIVVLAGNFGRGFGASFIEVGVVKDMVKKVD